MDENKIQIGSAAFGLDGLAGAGMARKKLPAMRSSGGALLCLMAGLTIFSAIQCANSDPDTRPSSSLDIGLGQAYRHKRYYNNEQEKLSWKSELTFTFFPQLPVCLFFARFHHHEPLRSSLL